MSIFNSSCFLRTKKLALFFFFVFFSSCNSENFVTRKFFTNPLIPKYFGESDINKWQSKITRSDTSIIYSFFDTLTFDASETINTISFTTFNDKYGYFFNIENYINSELAFVLADFRLIEKGKFLNKNSQFYWFYVKNNKEYSYIEYSFVNPIKIKVISTSDFIKPKDKLHSMYNLSFGL